MAQHGADHDVGSALRDLVLVVEPEPGEDTDELAQLVRQLCAELRELDIESITSATLENAPPVSAAAHNRLSTRSETVCSGWLCTPWTVSMVQWSHRSFSGPASCAPG
jgi:hypothetical protein